MVDFGMRLKELRTAKRLSQVQLAELINVSKSVISAYENDIRMPSYDILIKLARIFKVTSDYLLGINKQKSLDVSSLSKNQFEIICNLMDEFSK